MSRRLIEFNVGDTKSNQQTASKLDCTITINNNNEQIETPETKARVKSGNIQNQGFESKECKVSAPLRSIEHESLHEEELKAGLENSKLTLNRPDSLDFDAEPPTCVDITFNPKVNVAVNAKTRSVPSSAERFIVVSRQPVITAEEIDNNIEFIKKLNSILTSTLIDDNKKLLANILDDTGKIILSGQDLCELISVMLSTDEMEITPSQINISYQENIISSCLKIKISPFKGIINIKVDNQDFHNVQNEAYNVLTDKYKISLTSVYVP